MRGNLVEIKSMFAKKPELINAKCGSLGDTPLHYAARQGRREVVEFLCTNGADINAQNKFGHTPLYYAIEKNHKEVVDILRKYGGVERVAEQKQ